MIDKKWAVNCLRHHRNTAIISLAAEQLLNSDAIRLLAGKSILIKGDSVVFDPRPSDFLRYEYRLDLDQLIDEYTNHRQRLVDSLSEFYNSPRRVLIKESFEVTQAYANAIGEKNELKKEEWFQFARIVRNAISHDFHFKFSSFDRNYLPITYRAVTIDQSMDGKAMPSNVLPPGLTWELYSRFTAFVDSH